VHEHMVVEASNVSAQHEEVLVHCLMEESLSLSARTGSVHSYAPRRKVRRLAEHQGARPPRKPMKYAGLRA
jgi:hypothetical protein